MLFLVYVDDPLVGCAKVRKGTRLSDDKSYLVWSEESEREDQYLSDDKVVAKLMCDLANTIEGDDLRYSI